MTRFCRNTHPLQKIHGLIKRGEEIFCFVFQDCPAGLISSILLLSLWKGSMASSTSFEYDSYIDQNENN